ncbi:hypothetical protein BaRGS_00013715 [Batillaria attramentaria]|uniref:Uncharacterized protein n=1 Tax=Batillaria attramentaria TaxID=370345 RepID=A0ABD0L744_9CAEN
MVVMPGSVCKLGFPLRLREPANGRRPNRTTTVPPSRPSEDQTCFSVGREKYCDIIRSDRAQSVDVSCIDIGVPSCIVNTLNLNFSRRLTCSPESAVFLIKAAAMHVVHEKAVLEPLVVVVHEKAVLEPLVVVVHEKAVLEPLVVVVHEKAVLEPSW